MDLVSAIVLAIVQGLTEFWPISSSGHLVLVPRVLGWPDQGLAFDVALHFGTLLAVMFYFRREVFAVPLACGNALLGRPHQADDARLGFAVVVATIPAGIAGLLFKDFVATELRSPLLVAGTTAFYGTLLWVADRFRGSLADERAVTLPMALVIGCAQALAIIPGTSRSGITMTAALFLGLSRHAAARFSFLMSIPVILLASLVEGVEIARGATPVDPGVLVAGVATAAATAYLCIASLLRMVERIGMAPFAIYRLLLAAVLVAVFA